MKLSDTFPKEALYRVVLSMPIEVEVMATDRDAAEDDARPHAFEMLQEMIKEDTELASYELKHGITSLKVVKRKLKK